MKSAGWANWVPSPICSKTSAPSSSARLLDQLGELLGARPPPSCSSGSPGRGRVGPCLRSDSPLVRSIGPADRGGDAGTGRVPTYGGRRRRGSGRSDEDLQPLRLAGRLGPVTDAELTVDGGGVLLNRVRRKVQLTGDLFVGRAGRDQRQDLLLAVRQRRVERRSRRRPPGPGRRGARRGRRRPPTSPWR